MSTMYPGSLIHPCKCSPVILRYKILLRSIAFVLKAAANDLFYFSIMYIDTRTKSHLSPRLIRLFHFCIFLLPILLNIRRHPLFYHRTDYKPSPLNDLLLRISHQHRSVPLQPPARLLCMPAPLPLSYRYHLLITLSSIPPEAS